MSFFKRRQLNTNADDEYLVLSSLGGDRDAFAEIVSRYQNLLCSLAYSSVGNLKCSEDIAQETFVEAWKKLDTLREPAKLRSWLCGILRFKASHYHRKEGKQPPKAESDEQTLGSLEDEQSNLEQEAISQQHQTLMWKVLDSMEEVYREPLILYYREQQSVDMVAKKLDLTPDTTKQRLSRGRKLLKLAMADFVEEALSKSKPGAGFTAAVLFTISSIAPPAKAAVIGVGAVKGSTFVKLTTLLAFIASISGLVSSFFGTKASLAQSRTEAEKRHVIKIVSMFIGTAAVFVIAMLVMKSLAIGAGERTQWLVALLAQFTVLAFVLAYVVLLVKTTHSQQRLRAEERSRHPELFHREVDQEGSKKSEVISRLSLFGVPLYHFQLGMTEVNTKPAFGWIAGGSHAYGLLFAWGGFAIAPVSVGIISVGVVSIGAIGVACLALGTVAIGYIGFGASALSFKAYGSLSALGIESAFSGGFSMAVDGAIGAIAHASEVNSELAAEIVGLDLFNLTYQWGLGLIAILVLVPAIWHARKVQEKMR